MSTNIEFHRWLVAHPEFAAGHLSTRFLEEHFTPGALTPTAEQQEVALVAAALHAREERSKQALPSGNGGGERSSWRWGDRRRSSGWIKK